MQAPGTQSGFEAGPAPRISWQAHSGRWALAQAPGVGSGRLRGGREFGPLCSTLRYRRMAVPSRQLPGHGHAHQVLGVHAGRGAALLALPACLAGHLCAVRAVQLPHIALDRVADALQGSGGCDMGVLGGRSGNGGRSWGVECVQRRWAGERQPEAGWEGG